MAKTLHTYTTMIYLHPDERDALGLRRHITQATLQGQGYSAIDFARRAHAAGFTEGSSSPEALLRSWRVMSQLHPREEYAAERSRAELWPGAFILMAMDTYGNTGTVLVVTDQRGDFIAAPDPAPQGSGWGAKRVGPA